MIAKIGELFVGWLTFTLLATAVVVAAISLGELLRRAIRWLDGWRMYDSVSRRREVAKGYQAIAWSTPQNRWKWDETEPLAICPACLRMRQLHKQHPRLRLEQLEAIVRRQITLGHCRAHSYADAPD
jgi:hypothetical protein